MRDYKEYCTCDDLTCKLHPSNHDEGCTPCIMKNLKLKEIPNCFFNKLPFSHNKDDYSFENFANLVLKNNND